ncbi:MAG: RNA-binding transcriptional accessory protein [Bacilli bacterium]|nr:RNA-binding transcriptional accessory protein [Bacilli bacterium]
MNEVIINEVSNILNIKPKQIEAVIKLLSEGATIPFIARYRKEVTGYLNEDEIRTIHESYDYQVNLADRKENVIKLIDEKKMLTDEIKQAILACTKISEVDNIYEPFKEERKTKGTEAIKLGLEPLANLIMKFPKENKDVLAKPFLTDKVKTIDEAITNAGYIIADKINTNIAFRDYITENTKKFGFVETKVKKNAEDENKLYEIYYNFKEKISKIKSYQVLAINRATKEKVITYNIENDHNRMIDYLKSKILGNKEFPLRSDYEIFIEDAYKRLMFPSIERNIKSELFDKASQDGIKEFGINLENLLLTPPIKEAVVLGFDPAFRTGCKLAVVSPQGSVLEIGVIYPHEPKNDKDGSEKKLLELIKKHNVSIIAIGNGTASRESESFVAEVIKKNNLDTKFVIVSEAGASVYSASELAKKEFPDYSVEQRSAVSIARRLQDALSELVKIDPKSIGIGLYQHDLKPKELDEELDYVVSKIVNQVGVNINNASESLLSHVSGLDKKAIKGILEYKNEKGKIVERKELEKIKGINSHVYEQCAGFLRVLEGNNPLDKTNIHPEDYELVNNIIKDINFDLSLIGKEEGKEILDKIDDKLILNKYNISEDKLNMIKENLISGIIDPRSEIKKVTLKGDVLSIDDLEEGMELEGTVRNVLPFGAFIDIGLHDDALLHISKMSKEFVSHPNEILKVGDIIQVYVSDIDKEKQRVGLSLIK